MKTPQATRPGSSFLPDSATRPLPTARCFSFLLPLFLAVAVSQSAMAASATWNGTTDAVWATDTNWSATPVPGTGDTATFNNAGGAVDVIDLGAGVTIGNILFDTASVAAYTIGSGALNSQTLTLNDSGAITANSTINANQLFNAAIVLGTDATAQSYAITNNDASNSLTFNGTITGGSTGTAGIKTLTVTTAGGGVIIGGNITAGGATAIALTKNGTGTLTLNGANSTLGDVAVNDGTLLTENSMTFGNLSVASGKTFQFGAQNAVYTINMNGLAGAGTVTTNGSGGFQRTLNIGNGNATADFSGVLTQASNRALVLTKLGSGTQTLSGSGNNTQGGGTGVGFVTNVQAGTLVLNKTAAVALPGSVNVSGGTLQLSGTGDNQIADTAAVSISSGTLDLNGRSETFGAFTLTSAGNTTLTIGANKTLRNTGAVSIGAASGTTNLTLAGATGTYAVAAVSGNATNANFSIGGGGTATGTVDMSGLGTFTANLGTGTLAVGAGSTNGSGAVPYTLKLAGTSSITATKVSVGAGFVGTANASPYTMSLGSGNNTINTTDLYIGVYNNQGRGNTGTTLNFNTTTGTLTLRGLTGNATRANVYIGENNGGSTGTASGGSFNLSGSTSTSLSGGNADLLINALTISRRTAGSNDTSSMTFRSGTMDVNTLVIGRFTGTTGNSASGTLTLNGGTVVFNTGITLGINNSGTGTGTATLNVSGATVTATPGIIMGNQTLGTVNSTVNVSAGSLTLGSNITTVGATNTTLTLSGGTLDLGGFNIGTLALPIDTITVNPGTAATLRNVGTINGTAGITKTGAGVLTLNANNYAGATTISAGSVLIDGSDDLGDNSATNSISLNGTLRSTANSYDLGANRAITLAGAATIQSDAGALTVSGNVTNGANGLTLLGNGTIEVSGVIGTGATPTGGLTIGSTTVGANVTLSGDNLFTGNVGFGGNNTTPQGKLTIAHSGALGVGPKTINSTSSNNASGGIHLQNNITLAANLSITTSGFAMWNDSGSNTVNGNITMGSGNGNTYINSTSGLLTLNGNITANTTSRNLELRGDGDGIINGGISNGSSVGMQVRKNTGVGTWTLAGNNTYTGGTPITQGKLQFAKIQAMPSVGTVSVGTGAALNVNVGGTEEWTTGTSGNGTIGGLLSGTGGQGAAVTYTGAVTLGFDTTNASPATQTYSGAIGNVAGSSSLGITKLGSNSLELAGNNTFTGATAVTAGTLILSGGGSINTSSQVVVSSGATLTNDSVTALTTPLSLAENATINGTGNFTTTSLTIVGDLTGGAFATINSTGNFAASGSLAFTLANTTPGTYDLFSTAPASFSFASVSVGALPLVNSGGTFTANDGLFTYTFVNGADILEIAAIPEPSTWALVGLGFTLILVGARSRRARHLSARIG